MLKSDFHLVVSFGISAFNSFVEILVIDLPLFVCPVDISSKTFRLDQSLAISNITAGSETVDTIV